MVKDLPAKDFKSSVNTQTTSIKGEDPADPFVPRPKEIVNKNTSDSFRGFLLAAYKSISNNNKAIKFIKVTVIFYLLTNVILPPVAIMIAFLTFPDATARFFNFPIKPKLSLTQNGNSQILGESTSSTTGGNPVTGYLAGILKPNAEATVQTLRIIRPETVSDITIPSDQGDGSASTPPNTPSNNTPGSAGIPGEVGPQGLAGEVGSQGLTGINGVQGLQGEIGPSGLQGPSGQTGPAGPTGVPGSLGSLSTGAGLSGNITGGNLTLDLDTSVPTSVINDTNITGSIASNTLTLGWSGALASSRGGTGLTATPINGQLLIGNGTGYTMAGLTAGSNISITNGSGSITVNTSQTPTFTSVNGLTITNTGSNTLTIAAGKTLTSNNSLTFSGTDATNFTFPGSSDTVVGRSSTDTFTNKTISAGSNTIIGLTNTNLSGSAGITNANLANSSITITSGTGLSGGGTLSLGGNLTLTNSGVTSLTGTANQVNVSASTGGITISLPQSIGIGATPAFSGLTISSFGTGVVHSNSSGLLSSSAVNLVSDVSGTLPIVSGGTNITTYTIGDMLYASATNILGKLGIGSNGQVLTVTGGVPVWQSVSSGTVPFSSLTAAGVSNTLDNTTFAQTWNWSTANTGNTLTLSANLLTSGNGLVVSSTSTGLTGNLFQVTSGSTAAFTNGGVRFNFTGAHTGNGIQVDDVTATGTITKITGNSLTTGTGLLITTSNSSLNSTNGLLTISNTGTSANGSILKVQASSSNTNALVVNANGNSGFGIAPVGTSRLAMNGLTAAANGNVPLCISSGGSGGIFLGGSQTQCNTSSARYKHDIATLDDNLGLKAVLTLDPVSFTFNSNNQKNLGFIAEQVLTVDPRIVTLDENGLPNAIDSDQILPLLTKSIQQLHNGLTDPNVPITNIDGTKTFVGNFFDRLVDWFADRANNIGDFFANRVHTKTLCVGEKDNETCITKSQLDQLLLQSPKPSPNTSENTPSVSTTPTPTSQIIPSTTPTEQISSASASPL